ncbi:MAG: deoxyuridine 5'-triphosphate nucleotidohydrolase [Lachnospiraceae bacterium]|nr:deoxyuridine 5'-triphosphate nucleotidohydrolase [Lachnospiraceae bacterium]
MGNIAKFELVSTERFITDAENAFDINEVRAGEMYNALKLPVRATVGSAGYDFFSPTDIELEAGQSILIPTGVRVKMESGWVLLLFPRSGLGFKYRFQLDNSVGVIDQDYYFAKNEGHIMAKMTNDSREGKTLSIKAGQAFMQGVFVPFGLADEEEVTAKRVLGFGSTTGKAE